MVWDFIGEGLVNLMAEFQESNDILKVGLHWRRLVNLMAEFQEPNGILKVCDPYIITVMPKLKVLTFIKDYK